MGERAQLGATARLLIGSCVPQQAPLHVSGEHAQLCHTEKHGRKYCICQALSLGPSLSCLTGLLGPPGWSRKVERPAWCCLLSQAQVQHSSAASTAHSREACEDPHFLLKLAHRFCV